MKIEHKKIDEGEYVLFVYLVSHYAIGKFFSFANKIKLDSEIKSEWEPEQLILLSEYCQKLYDNDNK